MKWNIYLKEKLYIILLFLSLELFAFTTLCVFQINRYINIYLTVAFTICFIWVLIIEYWKRKRFYNQIIEQLNLLEKKYLVHELLGDLECSFQEGRFVKEILTQVNKCYFDDLEKYRISMENFKEYIELWLHEIKTPISSAKLIVENNKTKVTENILEEIEKMDDLVRQVMFYTRSEIVEHDYLIRPIELRQLLDRIIQKNKKVLITKKFKIDLAVEPDKIVKSDEKWLEYIIEQVVANAIKYTKQESASLEITTQQTTESTKLIIVDRGIGIKKSDVSRVFEKGFTGENGRKKYKSTGIGLYLSKKLCDKLNHDIELESIENEYTKVTIIFPIGSLSNNVIKGR